MNRWQCFARRLLLGSALAAPLGGGPAPAADDDPVPQVLPLHSEEDLDFVLDLSAYRGIDGKSDVEVYVALPNDQIGFRPEEGADEETGPFAGEISLELTFRRPDGETVARVTDRLEPRAASRLDAGDRTILQIIRERVELPPGVYHLVLVLEDSRSLRRGLLNRIRKKHKRGRIEDWVEVTDLSGGGFHLSDLTLTRRIGPAEPGSQFGRNGVDFDPNPSHYYGLVLSRVGAYLEVYGGEDFRPDDTFLVQTRIHDRSDADFVERVQRATPRTGSFVVTDILDLPPDMPAGSFHLEVAVMNERSGEMRVTGRPFEVIWGMSSWRRDAEEVLQEVALIMSDSEFDAFEKLSAGAREVYLAEFWHRLDPHPEIPGNEVHDEFRARVAYVERNFRSTLQRGVLTDRGRVFVRYGPPDEVNYKESSSGFGPTDREERVADPGERAGLTGRPSASFLDRDDFLEGDVEDVARQRGSATVKSKSLEIWTYDGRGRPLTDRIALDQDSHRGLKFIFADEMGNGDFQLIGSSGVSLH